MAERALRVLIADEQPQRAQALATVLAAAGYDVVDIADDDTPLPLRVSRCEPDVLLINTDSPSRDTLEQLSALHAARPFPVVMFAHDEDRQTIRAAVRAGVSAYVTQGLDNARVTPLIETAIAQFQQHQLVRDELKRTQQTLSERKTLDRAKGILMRRRGCDEQAAFGLLRQAAMNHKKRIGQVAEEIVQAAALLDAASAPTQGVNS